MDYDLVRYNTIRNTYRHGISTALSNFNPHWKTVILVPGGMGSQLIRTQDPFDELSMGVTQFDTVWMDPGILFQSDTLKLEIDSQGRDIKGSWLRFFKSSLETESMSCAVGRNQSFEFKFPYPDYGIIGDGTQWTGRGISNVDTQYNFLDDASKKIVDDIYWNNTATTEQVCAININHPREKLQTIIKLMIQIQIPFITMGMNMLGYISF